MGLANLIRSDEIGLMVDELIGAEVEDCGVDVSGVVCEQETVALLGAGEVVLFWSVHDIAIVDREVVDGVRA